MNPAYSKKKIIDCTDKELIRLGFLGPNSYPELVSMIESVRAHPQHLGNFTCFMLDCMKSTHERELAEQAEKDAIRRSTENLFSSCISSSSSEPIAPSLVSEYEANFYYHGLSSPLGPKLLYRSDLETNPFPVPEPGTKLEDIPYKTAHGVFGTPLKDVWEDVAPKVIASVKSHRVRFCALNSARFETTFANGEKSMGPVVIWITVRPDLPDTADADTGTRRARDATPNIMRILAENGIEDVVVEWTEGEIVRLIDERDD